MSPPDHHLFASDREVSDRPPSAGKAEKWVALFSRDAGLPPDPPHGGDGDSDDSGSDDESGLDQLLTRLQSCIDLASTVPPSELTPAQARDLAALANVMSVYYGLLRHV